MILAVCYWFLYGFHTFPQSYPLRWDFCNLYSYCISLEYHVCVSIGECLFYILIYFFLHSFFLFSTPSPLTACCLEGIWSFRYSAELWFVDPVYISGVCISNGQAMSTKSRILNGNIWKQSFESEHLIFME